MAELLGINGKKMEITHGASSAIENLEEIDPADIVCLQYRVLLKVVAIETITANGILIPDSAIEKTMFSKCSAEVVAIGEEACMMQDGLPWANRPKPGDKVMIAKYAGITVRDKDYNLYRFANDQDIVAIVKGETA